MKQASIVIPVYNQTSYLPAAVNSALAQTYPLVEVIVVDDGSAEDVPAALGAAAEKVTLIRQENRGLAAARNRGYAASRGDYLLFLDGDDLLDEHMLAACIARLEAEPDTALVYCGWKQVSANGQIEYGRVIPSYSGDILVPLLLRRFFFFASGTVVRRRVLEQVGLFDERLRWGEDADLWLRIARTGCSCACEPRPLLTYRVHALSMTAQVSAEQVAGWQAVLDQFFAAPGLPAPVAALRPEAYAVLHFETAGRFFRLGQVDEAREQLRLAAASHPRVEAEWFLEWLAGTANDPRTLHPLDLISTVLDSLPPELAHFRRLRRRAVGRYHTAAAFSRFFSGQPAGARPHLWPAVAGDPAVLSNPGFLRMALQTLTRGRRGA